MKVVYRSIQVDLYLYLQVGDHPMDYPRENQRCVIINDEQLYVERRQLGILNFLIQEYINKQDHPNSLFLHHEILKLPSQQNFYSCLHYETMKSSKLEFFYQY